MGRNRVKFHTREKQMLRNHRINRNQPMKSSGTEFFSKTFLKSDGGHFFVGFEPEVKRNPIYRFDRPILEFRRDISTNLPRKKKNPYLANNGDLLKSGP